MNRYVVTLFALVGLMTAGCADEGDNGQPAGSSASPTETPMVTSPGSPFPRAVDCASFTPEVLPSGAEPGQSRPYPPEDPEDHQMAWGEGRDLVVLSWGSESVADDLEGIEDHLMLDYDGTQAVAKEGMRRMVVPVGDPPLGGIGIRFAIDGCPYNLTINIEAADDGSGITLTEAISYAEQF